jgi:hypothetical protein
MVSRLRVTYQSWNEYRAENLQKLLKARQEFYASVMNNMSEVDFEIQEELKASNASLSAGYDPELAQEQAEEAAEKRIQNILQTASRIGGTTGKTLGELTGFTGGSTHTRMQRAHQALTLAQHFYNNDNIMIQDKINYHMHNARIFYAGQGAALAEQDRLIAEMDRHFELMQQEAIIFAQQQQFNPTGKMITIFNGKRFPNNRDVWLKIGSCLVYGRFQHEQIEFDGLSNFKVSKIVHPKACDYLGVFCTELDSARYAVYPHVVYGQYVSYADKVRESWVDNIAQGTFPDNIIEEPDSWSNRNLWDPYHDEENQVPGHNFRFPEDAIKFIFKDWSLWFIGQLRGSRAGFAWTPAGSSVRLAYSNPVEFIISIVPCEIKTIAAFRTYGNARHLVPIPTNWYTIEDRDYGDGLVAKVLKLGRPLDTIANVGFESAIYATVKSDVGPNVVDVIRYLIETYLPDITCDEESFERVKLETADWPVNFVLTDRLNIINLLSDICYQACIAIWKYDGTMFLRYLPNMPEVSEDISDEEIDITLSALIKVIE